MKGLPRLQFGRGDLLAVALVLLLAFSCAAAYMPKDVSGESACLQIWQDGVLLREEPLETDGEWLIEGEYRNTVTVRDGKACISESDCPGTDCVYSGDISSVGRSIVCLPNKVELRIVGVQSDVDFVVR